ncbi:hypothetical protein R0J91_20370, partial [Micrococcus sp. SIMBA_131]
ISLSSNGNIVAIGSYVKNNYAGQVRVFENINNVWTQIGQNINGESSQDYFGSSISLSSDGNILIIGAYGNDESESDYGQV